MSKYNAKKIVVDNIKFDSKVESEYYEYLKSTGVEFEIQPRFLLQEKFEKNGVKYRPIEYIADFKVGNIVIDIKGMETTDFKIKKKMFEYKYRDLELKLIVKSPKKYLEYSTGGFLEKKMYEDLKKKNKKNS